MIPQSILTPQPPPPPLPPSWMPLFGGGWGAVGVKTWLAYTDPPWQSHGPFFLHGAPNQSPGSLVRSPGTPDNPPLVRAALWTANTAKLGTK